MKNSIYKVSALCLSLLLPSVGNAACSLNDITGKTWKSVSVMPINSYKSLGDITAYCKITINPSNSSTLIPTQWNACSFTLNNDGFTPSYDNYLGSIMSGSITYSGDCTYDVKLTIRPPRIFTVQPPDIFTVQRIMLSDPTKTVAVGSTKAVVQGERVITTGTFSAVRLY